MKKLFLLLFANACFAQGFIEVEVRDTIVLKPVSYIYEISISDRMNYEEDYADNGPIDQLKRKAEKKNEMIKKTSELESYLKKKGYTFEPSKDYEVQNLFGMPKTKSYKVTLKTPEALEKLSQEVEEMDQYSGSLADVNYGDTSQLENKLLEKLIKRAKNKAAAIAAATNQKLGTIIEFKELKQSENFNTTFMEMLVSMKGRNGNPFFQSPGGEMAKGATVKFKTE